MNTYPSLQSSRLEMSRPLASDIPAIIKYAGHPQIAQFTSNIPHPYLEQHAIGWINAANEGWKSQKSYVFAIRLRPTGAFIGGIGLHLHKAYQQAEMGYWMAFPFWNKGYTSEAVGRILSFGFETLELHKIFATHMINNPASGKVLEKNGMIHEATMLDHLKKDEQYISLKQYRMLRREYEAMKG